MNLINEYFIKWYPLTLGIIVIVALLTQETVLWAVVHSFILAFVLQLVYNLFVGLVKHFSKENV